MVVGAANGAPLDIDSGPVTIAAWVNTQALGAPQAIAVRGLSNGISAGSNGYGLWLTADGRVNVGSTGGGNFNSKAALSANTWHHAVAVIDGAASKVFIDGVDQTPAGANVSVRASNIPLTLGAARNLNLSTGAQFHGQFFRGALDDVRVYQRALSAAEAQTVMDSAGPGPRVTAATWVGGRTSPLTGVRITFSKAIDLATFTAADLRVSGPGGVTIPVVALTTVSGSDNKQFEIAFAPQSLAGKYTLVVGPDIRDLRGKPMDQDNDGLFGEVLNDRYIAQFTLQ